MPAQPGPQPPAVQKLRVRYAKRGRLRFTSHRDFSRALERAVRRAGLPVAFSAGFSPHPRISYANASPTGAASEAEYLEISLVETVDPAAVRAVLDGALPPGLDIVEVVAASAGSLSERLEASRWRIALPQVPLATAAHSVSAFLACQVVEVERMTKNGRRRFDCRAAVVAMSAREDVADSGSCAILEVVVRHGTPAVRPDDILAGLRITAGLVLPVPPLQTRIEQGLLDPLTGSVMDPLDLDRDAS